MSDPIDLDRDLILQTFAAQSNEGLSTMEEALIDLEARPEDDEALHLIFRICHTLKGDASTVGFPSLGAFAHVLEDLLEQVRDRTISVDGALVTLLLEAVDALRELLADALSGRDGERTAHAPLLEKLRACAGKSAKGASVETPDASTGRPADDSAPLEGTRRAGVRETFRVSVDIIDRLLNLAGELAIARSRTAQLLDEESRLSRSELLEAHHATDHLFSELQHEVMKVRMVPVGPLFRRHGRTVRDLALDHGKSARLEIEGADAELDATVIEQLRDPLSHMIRNAIAHGIEPPEKRAAKGKDSCGCVTLRARHEGASILVQVEDDGAGLDRDRIRARARTLGLAAESEQLSDAEATELIFSPGLSTAEGATLAAGRGVGMDVVRRNIEALHGSVKVTSEPDKGTTIDIRLPLTLAIIEGFAVGLGEDTYVLPLSGVIECLDLPQGARRAGGARLINLRGKSLPYIPLRAVLGGSDASGQRQKIVVIRHGGEDVGIAVDKLYGEQQAVIKPLDRRFRDLPGIAGATILGNGRVALILDVPALLRRAIGYQAGGEGFESGCRGPTSGSRTAVEAPSGLDTWH